MLSSPPFYSKYIHLPNSNSPTPQEISSNPKYYPFFKDVIGALDGTHVPCSPLAEECEAYCNRKGGVSQNCLVVCSFDLRFLYVLSGWEGSIVDMAMYRDAHAVDLPILEGKTYLADAGFGACDTLLVPFQKEWYHLQEFGHSSLWYLLSFHSSLSMTHHFCRPQNHWELYNLQHAQLWNCVEHIFGIVKWCFAILQWAPSYPMTVQVWVLPALCCLHNFIWWHDADEISSFEIPHNDRLSGHCGELQCGTITWQESTCASAAQDGIAQAMWDGYQTYLAAHR